MSKGMTLDKFNEIMLGALKEGTPKSKLFEVEAREAEKMMFCEMLDLVELLNDGKPYEEQLQRVNIIANNLGNILDKLEAAKAEEAAAEGKGK